MSVAYAMNPDSTAWRQIEGEMVLMRLKDGAVFSLEETGAFIWGVLANGPHSEDELVRQVCDEFEVDEQSARADLAEFLAEMLAAGLIKSSDDAPSDARSKDDPAQNE
jgi:hypothetical protein